MCLEWLEKNATGVLLALLIILVIVVIWRKDSMCGGMDQGCKCCGYEPMAAMRNRRVEGMSGAVMHDRVVEGMQGAVMHDRVVEGMKGGAVMYDRRVGIAPQDRADGFAVMHDGVVTEGMAGMYGNQASDSMLGDMGYQANDSMMGMFGNQATESLLARPIVYDDLLFNVQQGTV